MPVLRAGNLAEKPHWLKASGCGIFHVAKGDPADFDLHYHDTDEIWYITEGRAWILTEGGEYDVRPGDIVCTGMGDEHHSLAVPDDLVGFYCTYELEGLKRWGHAHCDEHGIPGPRRRPNPVSGDV